MSTDARVSQARALGSTADTATIRRATKELAVRRCEGGRILRHLNHGLGDEKNSVAIVGFQAQHTLGRKLPERRRCVRVFGMDRDVHAQVHVLDGLSAHADQRGLVQFAEVTRKLGNVSTVALVHGEPSAQQALSHALAERGFSNVVVGMPGQGIAV